MRIGEGPGVERVETSRDQSLKAELKDGVPRISDWQGSSLFVSGRADGKREQGAQMEIVEMGKRREILRTGLRVDGCTTSGVIVLGGLLWDSITLLI